jgi:glucuronoarabinoxylan endo-1,4-beta-xylanase
MGAEIRENVCTPFQLSNDATTITKSNLYQMNIRKIFSLFLMMMPATGVIAVNVNVNVKNVMYQHITGFGAAALWDLMVPVQDTTNVIGPLFGPKSPVGLNIMRIEIIGDQANSSNDNQWWDDPYDWNGYLKAVKCARAHGAIILAAPWSPPAKYKTNGTGAGLGPDTVIVNGKKTLEVGKLRTDCYSKFFPWLNTYLAYMKGQGAPIDIVSLQNEPDYKVTYSGCYYTATELHDLVAKYAKRLDKKNLGVKLMTGESFSYNPVYTDSLLNDSLSRQYIDYVGGHFYTGIKPKAGDTALKYGIEAWMTEHIFTPEGQSDNDNKPLDSPTWDEQIQFVNEVNSSLNANLSAYVYWYMRCPNGFMGDGKTVKSGKGNEDKKILTRGYLMAHFTKYLIGAQRMGATISDPNNMQTSAYLKGDSLIVLVTNRNTWPSTFTTTISLPFYVKSGTRMTSLSDSSLCKKEDLDISEPTKKPVFAVKAQSVNTFCFQVDWEKTGIKPIITKKKEDRVAVYNIQGILVKNATAENPLASLPHGIYIVNGKKIAK